MKTVYIVSAKRTPIGGFLGSLSGLSATQLGATAIEHAYKAINLNPELIDAIYMGNVLSAGLGQSPARQAGIFAAIPADKDATTINKVCASGMKATMLAAQQIQIGINDIVVSGGMESMSNVPHYSLLRKGNKLGDLNLIDGLVKDGLWDVYNNFHMGSAAELGATKYNLSREMQDAYAIASYTKSQTATKEGKFKNEIIPVKISSKGENALLSYDEDIDKIIFDKVAKLKPTFEKTGTHTAANSSNLNDGAASLILASEEAVKKYNLTPLAKIVSFADAAQSPEWFTTSPSVAINKVLNQTNLTINDIDFFEINEAYASVALSNTKILNLNADKLNVYGGAVAMGHPIGASGARIIVTLLSVLKQEGGKLGMAAICNGGGGASAILIEKI